MSERPLHHYLTTDPEQVRLFKEWMARNEAWEAKTHAIAARLGRKPVESFSYGGRRFVAFSLLPGEPTTSAGWVGTPWVLTDSGFIRPRISHREGKRLAAEMEEIGQIPHAAEALRGIPKMVGMLGRPGLMLTPDKNGVVASYPEPVKHDARWAPMKTSAYWQMREAQEASA